MVFADDERESNPVSFKILEMAHKWKKAQVTGGDTTGLLRGLGSKNFVASTSATEEREERQEERKDAEIGTKATRDEEDDEDSSSEASSSGGD